MKFREALISALTASIVSAATALAISPPFSTPWTTSYESIPADTEAESLGASRIRDLKVQLRQRLSQDHSWAGDGNDGYHKWVTLLQQTQNPIPSFDAGATGGSLFTESVGGEAELIYADNNGHTTQLTSQGSISQNVPPGSVLYYAGQNVPSGYLLGNGAAVSRTTYSNLFANVGTTYGNGDGTSTFNLPDCRASYVAGGDASNSTGRLTGLTGGVSAASLGNRGGSQQFTIAAANLPQLGVSITDPGHSHLLDGGTAIHVQLAVAGASATDQTSGASRQIADLSTTSSATTGITATANTGGADNPITSGLPPTIIFNCIIKTENEESPLSDTYAESDSKDSRKAGSTLSSLDGLLERRPELLTAASLYS